MKLQEKLLLAMLPIILAMLFVGYLASTNISKLGEHSQLILKDNFCSVLAVQGMVEAIERIDSAALFKLTGKPDEAAEMIASFVPVFERNLRIEEGNITEPGEQETVTALRSQWDKFRALAAQVILQPVEEAGFTYHRQMYPLFVEIKRRTRSILEMNQDAMVHKSDRAREAAERMNRLTLATILVFSLLGILLSGYFGKRFLYPLSILSQTVRRVGEGDLEARAVVDGTDEVATLAREFNTMADRLLQYRKSSLGDLLFAQQVSQAVLDSLPDPALVIGTDGTRIASNESADADIGVQATGTELNKLVEKISQHVCSGKGAFLPKGFDEAVPVEVKGEVRFYLPRGTPLLEDKKIIGATVLLQDVTRLRRFDQLKTDLVSTVAHEFRTPLTSLQMAIHLLLERVAGELAAKQEDLLYASRSDCERLQSLVDDLLDLSRLQSGKARMLLEDIPAQSLAETTLAAHRLLAEETGRILSSRIAPERLIVSADRERILTVLKNLVANAIRHAPGGSVIELALSGSDGEVRFEVKDAGPGIPPEFLGRVFDKFFRIPGTSGPGTGLGLTICKEIVEAHQGRIGVDSVVGKGSVFWFSLPLRVDGV